MSVRNLVWFWGSRVRTRLVQELFALVGIAVGVALLFAVLVSNGSPAASIAQLTDGLVGDATYQLKSRGPEGFDGRLVAEVERIDGVTAAAPVLEAQANATNDGRETPVTLLAADPRLARLGGSMLSRYTADQLGHLQAVVLPSSVARNLDISFGGPVILQLDGRSIAAPVGLIATGEQVGPLATSPVVVTSLRYGQQIAGLEGRVTRVYVATESGRSGEVAEALRDLGSRYGVDVLDTGHDGRVFADLALPNDRSTSLFAGIGAVVGFLFAFNAVLVVARDRRGLIAEMRLAGFRARTTVTVILFDAVVLGVAASIVGVVLGDALSRSVFEPDPGYLSIAFPVGTARSVDVATVLLAFGCGIAAAVAAALVPVLGVLIGGRPMDAVDYAATGRDGVPRARHGALLTGGLACLAATLLVSALAPGAAVPGMGTLIVAMLLLLWPILAAVLAAVARLRTRITSAVPDIAVGELRAMSTRSIAIAAIAATAVFGTTSILAARDDLQRGLDPSASELAGAADVWVTARGGSNLLATSPFDAGQLSRRLASAGISARAYRGSFLDTGDRRMWVIAPPTDARAMVPRSQIVEGDADLAASRVRLGGWAVASEAIAEQEGLRVGEPFTLRSPTPIRLRLAAVSTNLGWSPGTMIVNADDYQDGWGSDAASAVLVDLPDDTTPAAGRAAVQAALGAGAPFLVQTAAEREEGFRQTTRAGLSRLQQIATLLLVAAALATAAATGAMIWQRRRRLADLKLAGLTARSLWKALILESAILLGVGSIVGFVAGLLGRHLLDRALATVTGFPVDYAAGLPTSSILLVLVPLVSIAVAALPGYYAARVPASAAFD